MIADFLARVSTLGIVLGIGVLYVCLAIAAYEMTHRGSDD